jgi:hypothetical protein
VGGWVRGGCGGFVFEFARCEREDKGGSEGFELARVGESEDKGEAHSYEVMK